MSNHEINKFILSLQKGVYLHEYMNNWKKLSEILLPEKEDFYSHLNMKNITDTDYTYAKRVCKGFKIKHLGVYLHFYVKSNKLLLNNKFENFRYMCLKIYELDLARFLIALGLAWQVAWKRLK